MTVPALGRPGILRWDLTRHELSSLPYSPDTVGRVGKGATRGGELIICGFSRFHSLSTVDCPLFIKNNLQCFTVLLKRLLWNPIF